MGIAKVVLWFWGVMFFLGIPTAFSLGFSNGWWAWVGMGAFVGAMMAFASILWALNILWPYDEY